MYQAIGAHRVDSFASEGKLLLQFTLSENFRVAYNISRCRRAAGYFQDGRRWKTRGAFDGYLERPRGIRDILTFQRSGFWYRGAHLMPLQSLVQSFQRREQQVSRASNKFPSLLYAVTPIFGVLETVSNSCCRRFQEIKL